MTDKEKILAIKSEIERLSNFANGYYADRIASGYKICCSDIISFIDSLPQEEPASEDLEKVTYQGEEYIRCYHDELDEFANKYPKTVPPPEKKYAKYSDVDMVIAVKVGAKWQKQQMMAKAVDATVHIDAGGYPYIPQMELYDYEKDIPLAKEGDKVKILVIKES